jgi:hypothetical protein
VEQNMKISNQSQIDLEKLPKEAKKEVIDFYKLLLKKYKKDVESEIDDVEVFFNSYNIDLTSFKFDRNEANER